MAIKITQQVDLPPVYICPTCLKPTPFQVGDPLHRIVHQPKVCEGREKFNLAVEEMFPPMSRGTKKAEAKAAPMKPAAKVTKAAESREKRLAFGGGAA
jgi:hypothetical protein